MTQKLEEHEKAVLLDLCRKAENDTLEAIQRTLAIAPIEARASIVIHNAFTLTLQAAMLLEVAHVQAQGGTPNKGRYSFGPPGEGEPHVEALRGLARAFANYPDMGAIDAGVRRTIEALGISTREEG